LYGRWPAAYNSNRFLAGGSNLQREPRVAVPFNGFEAAYSRSQPMQIKLSSIMVDDQDKALRFYTAVVAS